MSWDNGKSLVSFILGLIIIALGGIPLLNQWNIIGFGLPDFLTGIVSSVILWIIAGSGLYLLIESFMQGLDSGMGKTALIAGIIVLALGLVPLLNELGVISFAVPFLSWMLFQIIFVIEGILMIIGAFNM
jgi:hypothetical protein